MGRAQAEATCRYGHYAPTRSPVLTSGIAHAWSGTDRVRCTRSGIPVPVLTWGMVLLVEKVLFQYNGDVSQVAPTLLSLNTKYDASY
eukprot:3457429-Rhodomonas_salina.1